MENKTLNNLYENIDNSNHFIDRLKAIKKKWKTFVMICGNPDDYHKTDEYTKILKGQREALTPAMLQAIKIQGELRDICKVKQSCFYELEDKYRSIVAKGIDLLFDQYPELRNELPIGETKAEQINAIIQGVKNPKSTCRNISELMHTVPQLVEAEKMNVEIGKACVEYFVSLANLNNMFVKSCLYKRGEKIQDKVQDREQDRISFRQIQMFLPK